VDPIATAIAGADAALMERLMLADPILVRRLGFAVARRRGLVCLSSTVRRGPVFNRALGFGTFAPPSQRAIDAMLRHYAALGLPARFQIIHPGLDHGAVGLLARNGFARERGGFILNVIEPRSLPPQREAVGLDIARVARSHAERYAKLATRGFEERGQLALVWQRGWRRAIARDRRVSAFIGRSAGVDAATGILFTVGPAAGLFSGSVLRRFRGRGFQRAMIAARLRYGYGRGTRLFFSMTDHDTPSAHNLRDEGFRPRYELRRYARETS
jgi:hypothetical protein